MIIQSNAKSESLRIEPERIESGGYSQTVYAITASVGENAVANPAVTFEKPEEFLQSLKEFERTRKGSALLTGTEECQVTIEPDGGSGAAWLSFNVAKYLYTASPQTGRGRSGKISLTSGFSISGEDVGALVQDFAQMLQ